MTINQRAQALHSKPGIYIVGAGIVGTTSEAILRSQNGQRQLRAARKVIRREIKSMDASIGRRRWKRCEHESCAKCHGTGHANDGSFCIHMFSCSCPKCSPTVFGINWAKSPSEGPIANSYRPGTDD